MNVYLSPVGHDEGGSRLGQRCVGGLNVLDVGEPLAHVLDRDRIVGDDLGSACLEPLNSRNRAAVPNVVSAGFERKPEHCHPFAGDDGWGDVARWRQIKQNLEIAQAALALYGFAPDDSHAAAARIAESTTERRERGAFGDETSRTTA